MPHRIEIELTSARDDGTWTWRAAGARQPKGTLSAALLYDGAKVGDVVRADATFDLDGITVVSVFPPKTKREEPERLKILGSSDEAAAASTPSGDPRRGRDRDRAPEGRGRPGGRGDRDRDRVKEGSRPGGRSPRTHREPKRDRVSTQHEGANGRHQHRPPRSERPAGEPAAKMKPKRLQPGRAHRDAVLAGLPTEQQPIAEQVLKGGIPAVRQAVERENAAALAEGRPQIKADALVSLAEELLPRLRAAEWLDRAEAALTNLETLALRDLRSLVASADAAEKDETGRTMATQLRDALSKRMADLREQWLGEVIRALDEGRVVRALRISSRPPEPGTRFPAELAGRLAEAASAAMAPDTAPERWATLLDAVASSPVRRSVKPQGLPTEPGDQLLAEARKVASRVPTLAPLLGIEVPPASARSGRSSLPPPTSGPALAAPRRPRPSPARNVPAGTGSSGAARPDAETAPPRSPGRPPMPSSEEEGDSGALSAESEPPVPTPSPTG